MVYGGHDDEKGYTHLINPSVDRGSMKEIMHTPNSSPDPWLVSDSEMAVNRETILLQTYKRGGNREERVS